MLDSISTQVQRGSLARVLIAVVISAFIVFLLLLTGCTGSGSASQETSNEQASATDEEENLVDNPIDFAALQAQNKDIYAWLYFPEMDISRPIFQSSFDDIDFYLWRDSNGNYNGEGEAYSQPFNSKDFSDPVTLIYGHSIQGTTIGFTNLHQLEDPATFDANDYFYIITPDRILTYRIITVQEVSDEHILRNDFSTAEGQQDYFDRLLNPTANIALVRDNVTLIGGESKLVHLVTCPVPDKSATRFIVGGLLVEEQKTE